MAKNGVTQRDIWKAIVESLEELARLGTAGGYFGVLWALLGDLEYFWQDLGLASYNGNDHPCNLCPGNATTVPWRDLRPKMKPLWTHLIYSINEFLMVCPGLLTQGKPRHVIFTLAGVSHHTVMLDVLHCKYLGTDQYFGGSVMWLLVYVILPGIRVYTNYIMALDLEDVRANT